MSFIKFLVALVVTVVFVSQANAADGGTPTSAKKEDKKPTPAKKEEPKKSPAPSASPAPKAADKK